MQFRAPRGTHDVLPADAPARDRIVSLARATAAAAGYRAFEPPTFEQADLFVRGVGDGTDIVEKEMYIFEDRGGERLALRPEGTASVCRAYVEHGMANAPQPAKLFYVLPIFRYERPQAGRYRQHTQFGLEAIGVRDPALDAEVIAVGWRITQELGLRDLTLLFNSIGDGEDRRAYVPLLRAHFAPHLDAMCGDCRGRFDRAPLRLLDCKHEGCAPVPGGRAVDRGSPAAGVARVRRGGAGASRRRWASPCGASRGWCGASTTTRTRCSRSCRRGPGRK